MKKKLAFIILEFLLISIFVFFATSIVDARAGGGHRFSGGGFRSSSRSFSRSSSRSFSHSRGSHRYSGSSTTIIDDMSASTMLLLFVTHLVFSVLVAKACLKDANIDISEKIGYCVAILIISCPAFFFTWIAIPFLILYIVTDKKITNNFQDYNFKPISDFSLIKSKDPAFNKDVFLERAMNAFIIVQNAWSDRNLSKAEAFLADGTYEQFQIQINAMKANHEIDLMKDINIKKAEIVRLTSKAGYDSLSVQFTVSAVNYRINDISKIIKDGSTSLEEFSEVWTFMRRTGSKTIENGLIEGYCPNCGAQVEGARISKCPSCSALLRSGQHDWILAGITQACEWRDASVNDPIAYKSMINADESLNITHLEDKLTVIFWRLVESNRLGNSEPVHKVSTDDFAKAYSNSCYSAAFPKCKECAIGSAEVVGFITNKNDYDYLIGQVLWSGISISNNSDVLNKTMFVLRRKKGVVSDLSKCFCSTHCPNCGAKEPNDLSSNTCEYCNLAFNDDSKDWMLCDVVDFRNAKSSSYIKDALESVNYINAAKQSSYEPIDKYTPGSVNYNAFDYYSGIDLLSITVAMMVADGILDDREMNIIHSIRKARSISENELNQIINRLFKSPDPVKLVLETTAIKLDENLIRLLITIAAADGKIDYTEVEMLNKVAEIMGLSQNRLRDMINEVYESLWNKK